MIDKMEIKPKSEKYKWRRYGNDACRRFVQSRHVRDETEGRGPNRNKKRKLLNFERARNWKVALYQEEKISFLFRFKKFEALNLNLILSLAENGSITYKKYIWIFRKRDFKTLKNQVSKLVRVSQNNRFWPNQTVQTTISCTYIFLKTFFCTQCLFLT